MGDPEQMLLKSRFYLTTDGIFDQRFGGSAEYCTICRMPQQTSTDERRSSSHLRSLSRHRPYGICGPVTAKSQSAYSGILI